MATSCPHCQRSLDDLQGMFPLVVTCPGCSRAVSLPAIELTSTVRRKNGRKSRQATPWIVAGCAVLPLVVLVVALYWFGAATRILEPDRYLIENYLRSHANDPRDFEVVEWGEAKPYVRELNQQPATSYTVTVRARNVVGALTIHRMQMSVSGGEVIEAVQLD